MGDDNGQKVLDASNIEAASITLMAKLDNKRKGDLITAAEIVEWTGFHEWDQFRRVIRRWAVARKFELERVPRDGYRIRLDREHVVAAEGYRRGAARRNAKALRALMNVNERELNDRELLNVQSHRRRAADRCAMDASHQKEVIKELRGESRPPLRVITDGAKK